MPVKLIALDLDGTLKNDQKQITPKTREALMAAQRSGVRLALASARPSPGLFKERDILQIQQFGGILMSYNGGRITDGASGQVLFETAMELQQAGIGIAMGNAAQSVKAAADYVTLSNNEDGIAVALEKLLV